MTKAIWVAAICSVVIGTLAAIEIAANYYVPAWPARALRSTLPPVRSAVNSWGMSDVERKIAKPADVRFRAVLVGDSFVKGQPYQPTPTMAVEQLAAENGLKGLEAINLGVDNTDPRSYYYRTRDVALLLSPDAVFVFFFSGNDFMYQGYGDGWIPTLVDESPGGGVLGTIMPRTSWWLVDHLRRSASPGGGNPIPHENETLESIALGPPEQRVPRLVEHMKRYYHPNVSEERLAEIIARGGENFWRPYQKGAMPQEALQGWVVDILVTAELKDIPINDIRTPDDAAKLITGQEIEATLSWLVALNRAAMARKVPLRVFMIPTANVTPDFVEFWKPWPRHLGWYVLCDVLHRRLVEALRQNNVPVVDLRKDLLGTRGAYRLTDAHWSTMGVQIVAKRIYAELGNLTPH
jgi:hypothetical protein